MPDIHARYFESSADIVKFIEHNKTKIRSIVAQETGYDVNTIEFVPYPIPARAERLADNLLSLAFTVDIGAHGTTSEEMAELRAGNIKLRIASECPGAYNIDFGVWLRSHMVNGYSVHTPATLG